MTTLQPPSSVDDRVSFGATTAEDSCHENPLCRFRHVLHSCHRISKIDGRPFYLDKRLVEWFRDPAQRRPHGAHHGQKNVEQLLGKVFHTGSAQHQTFVSRFLDHMAEDDDNCWLRVFAVLLHMDLDVAKATSEVDPAVLSSVELCNAKRLNWFWSSNLLDRKLPISRDELRDMCNLQDFSGDMSEEFITKFRKVQCSLCSWDALNNLQGRGFGPETTVIPISEKRPAKRDPSGKSSNIFRVHAPVECIPSSLAAKLSILPFTQDGNEYQQFALKVLRHRTDFDREKLAYEAFAESKSTTTGMFVQCLGTWIYTEPPAVEPGNPPALSATAGKTEYYLLLEWGEYDLDDHFKISAPLFTIDEIFKFWTSLMHVTSTLGEIHDMEFRHGQHKYLGLHSDLKPENILLCKETHLQGWKIGDPGFVKLVRVDEADQDIDGLPVIKIEGTTMTYGGPERSNDGPVYVTSKFDIWSLGCVFSEAATWLVLGRRGVLQYRTVREVLVGTDLCFHKGSRVADAVSEWHTLLRQALRRCDTVTERILDLVDKHMLAMPVKDRKSAKELAGEMALILQGGGDQNNLKSGTSAMSTSPASFPNFLRAFQEEQKTESSSLLDPNRHRETSSWKFVGKSTRFVDTTVAQIDMGTSDTATAAMGGQLANIPESHTPVPGPPTLGSTMGPTNRSKLNLKASSFKDSDAPKLTYWEARIMLEADGWKSGTLIPPGSSTLPWTLTQSVSAPQLSVADVSNFSRTPRLNSLFRMMSFKSNKPPTSDKARGRSARKPSTLAASRSPAPSPSLPPDDMKYRALNEFFVERDIIFLVDNDATDSTGNLSMGHHWPYAQDLLSVLAAILNGQVTSGMDLFFTSGEKFHGCRTPSDFGKHMTEMSPARIAGGTAATNKHDIRQSIRDILDLWKKPESFKKKMTLIILTDGIWANIDDPGTIKTQIVSTLELCDPKRLEQRDLSIQFIQFGKDRKATEFFEEIDDKIFSFSGVQLPDIIDHEPADGDVVKMVLGSISDLWDRRPSSAQGGSSSPLSLLTQDVTQDVTRDGAVFVASPVALTPSGS